LLTARELAGLMGFRDAQQVLDLRQTDVQFPEPLGRVNRSFVWSWPQVEAWTKAHAGLISGAVGALLVPRATVVTRGMSIRSSHR
jgi:hypothetical protein